jgi:6-phosphogluconolactonase
MNAERKVYPTVDETAHACGLHILSLLEAAIAANGRANLAISGGSSPKLMFQHMVAAKFDWSSVQIFWVDERAVPPDHAESNYRMAKEALLQPAGVPAENIFRIEAELDPLEAAKRYTAAIQRAFGLENKELPKLDVIHLGMGPDAHTASLFPGEPLIEDRVQIAAAVYVEKISQWRITLLPGVLLNAAHRVFLAAGADKAEALNNVFGVAEAPTRFPAQTIVREAASSLWFIDEAAQRKA